MSSYRFCRTDDIGLLVDALNRCWTPHFTNEPPMTPAAFKRSIRDLQVWCSSCMVAFAGADPIGVLIGAKRKTATLIHRLAVHPDHVRQGHGRHLLTSLSSKLAILGPPRIVAEVPETLDAAFRLFITCGYAQEALLTDYVLESEENGGRSAGSLDPPSLRYGVADPAALTNHFVIPVTVDDLAANGLLEEIHPQACWERSAETLAARKDDIAGLAVASDERIEAYLLHMKGGEIVSLRSMVDDRGARLEQLVSQLRAHGLETLRLPKVHPAEISHEQLESLGFRPGSAHRLYATRARAE